MRTILALAIAATIAVSAAAAGFPTNRRLLQDGDTCANTFTSMCVAGTGAATTPGSCPVGSCQACGGSTNGGNFELTCAEPSVRCTKPGTSEFRVNTQSVTLSDGTSVRIAELDCGGEVSGVCCYNWVSQLCSDRARSDVALYEHHRCR